MTNYQGLWLERAIEALHKLQSSQADAIAEAAAWSAEAIGSDGMVHLFGSGHSRIPVEEMFPRYASFPGFNPMVELSTSFHTQIVGSNGQRQAMFIERVSGMAETVLANYNFGPNDVYLGFSVSGSNAMPVEMLLGAKTRGLKTIAVTSVAAGGSMARHADLVIDLDVPNGDALVSIEGAESPVGPVSTLLYVAIVNEIKVQTAALLGAEGKLPPVLTGEAVVGAERSKELFEAAYDEHARRASRILHGAQSGVASIHA
ncbi:hypothetical protein B7R22_02415 [Subtercola boreus]|uniref:SIS domain-containing protein n=2 Tax=Subtercola boreus TaxID=120213 RepID=A0A3E0W4P9_9MICO|nr:hypothetical protein B7R22_02415 [Subtercola boreus]